jgi:hypothetical protein
VSGGQKSLPFCTIQIEVILFDNIRLLWMENARCFFNVLSAMM